MHPGRAFVLVMSACGASVDGPPAGTTDAPPGSIDAPPDAAPDARPCTGGDASMPAPDGSCFVFFQAPQTFADATATCAGIAAHLALIKSTELDAAAVSLVGNLDTFIGLTDQASEGTFVWVDNTPLAFSNWEPPDEPNNGNGQYQEDCGIIAAARVTKQWDDRPCAPVPGVGGGLYAALCQF